MAVMATGMHPVRNFGRMFKFIQLLHGQRVDIRAQANRPIAVTIAADNADNPGLAHAAMYLDPEGLQLCGNEVRGPHLFIANLGMLMQLTAPLAHFLFALGKRIDNRHMSRSSLFTLTNHVPAKAAMRQGSDMMHAPTALRRFVTTAA
jgi:hypothetical protein